MTEARNERRRARVLLTTVNSGDVAPVAADMAPVTDGEWRLLVVGHAFPADVYVELVREAFGGLPTSLEVVDVRDGDRTTDEAALPRGVTVRVEPRGNLPTVSAHVSEFLTRPHDADLPVFVWYDSISHALEHASRSAVFRSLHRLSVTVRATGGTGYYWLAPEADARTRAAFGPLFDGVVPAKHTVG